MYEIPCSVIFVDYILHKIQFYCLCSFCFAIRYSTWQQDFFNASRSSSGIGKRLCILKDFLCFSDCCMLIQRILIRTLCTYVCFLEQGVIKSITQSYLQSYVLEYKLMKNSEQSNVICVTKTLIGY